MGQRSRPHRRKTLPQRPQTHLRRSRDVCRGSGGGGRGGSVQLLRAAAQNDGVRRGVAGAVSEGGVSRNGHSGAICAGHAVSAGQRVALGPSQVEGAVDHRVDEAVAHAEEEDVLHQLLAELQRKKEAI